jgi:replication-associated recombination protein RarA
MHSLQHCIAGETWTRRAQKSLLGKLVQSSMNSTSQKTEKDKAFDLLDALSRSVRWSPLDWPLSVFCQLGQFLPRCAVSY